MKFETFPPLEFLIFDRYNRIGEHLENYRTLSIEYIKTMFLMH